MESLGDKAGAVDAFLDHIARFGNDPKSNAKFALDEATNILGELRQSSTDASGKLDPQVQRVQDRFLPVAINPPFNHTEFAQLWASTLLDQEKWADALKYYQMVPDTAPPAQRLSACYGQMVGAQGAGGISRRLIRPAQAMDGTDSTPGRQGEFTGQYGA